ncbi:MAG: helix-turn-helix domain-containing protein, partial [Acidobacteriota bacterium]
DASIEESFWRRVRSAIAPSLRRLKGWPSRAEGDGKDWVELQQRCNYYGEYLKRLRENRGLTLEEATRETGITSSLLRSLEEEDEAALPRGKKRTSLLRRYALWLGLDSDNGRR